MVLRTKKGLWKISIVSKSKGNLVPNENGKFYLVEDLLSPTRFVAGTMTEIYDFIGYIPVVDR